MMFWAKLKPLAAVLIAAALAGTGTLALIAQEGLTTTAAEATRPPTIILDERSPWRVFYSWNAVGAETDNGVGQGGAAGNLHFTTLYPANQWREPDFDDSAWARLHLTHKPANCLAVRQFSLRGKFTVTDPAKVASLHFTLALKGGAAVYLNGDEVARSNLAAGAVGPGASALGPSGKVEERTVPTRLLRAGVNVLAIEIHTADPDSKTVAKFDSRYGYLPPACELDSVRLEANSGAGIIPNVERPQGARVWNSNMVAPLYQWDWGDCHENLRPIALAGARNGYYSGRVVVTSDRAIRDLHASVSDLSGPSGTKIPNSCCRVGHGAFQWEFPNGELLTDYLYSCGFNAFEKPAEHKVGNTVTRKHLHEDSLKDAPFPTVPVSEKYGGAIQSVWVTVHVPNEAAAGDYQGALTLTMQGLQPVEVPVTLRVINWTLPAPDDFAYFLSIVESPYVLAQCYGVEPWSEKHLALVGQSLEYLRKLGNKTLFIPLVADTQYNNPQSMVRLIKDGAGGFKHDFSPMEYYLDVALRRGWKPRYVVLGVWDRNITYGYDLEEPKNVITVIDPQTGKVSSHAFAHGTPEALELWKPILIRAQKILAERGLGRAMVLGHFADQLPHVETVKLFHSVLPDVGWMGTRHAMINFLRYEGDENPSRGLHGDGSGRHYAARNQGKTPPGAVPVVCLASVDGNQSDWDPGDRRVYGWKNPTDHAWTLRYMVEMPLEYRVLCEQSLLAGRRGSGQIGADFFPYQVRTASGASVVFPHVPRMLGLYPSCLLRSGPEGPVRSVAYEMFRENLQECEARTFLERLLTAEPCPLPAGLAKKCQEVLDQRTRWHRLGQSGMFSTAARAHVDFRPMSYSWPHSGMPQRTIELYEACAEAARSGGLAR